MNICFTPCKPVFNEPYHTTDIIANIAAHVGAGSSSDIKISARDIKISIDLQLLYHDLLASARWVKKKEKIIIVKRQNLKNEKEQWWWNKKQKNVPLIENWSNCQA